MYCVLVLCAFNVGVINHSMESQLVDMERKYHVVSRWKQSDKDYLDAKVAFFAENKKQLASCLWASVVRRHYLLKMKAKYAGEHTMEVGMWLSAQY